ncbi:MAG: tyrosine-type recombinase/integrase, partial [Pseudolabrys sp.]
MAAKLTDAVVKALPAPTSGEKITYDEAMKGFGIRVTAAGARSFVLNYRTRLGRERRYTIGRFPNWKTSPARTEALELRKVVDRGGDPLGDIHAGRKAPTVADLCDRFEAEHLSRLRPSTQTSYRQQITSEVRPSLGSLKVAEVSFSDIDRLHRAISKRAPYRANRVLALVSKMFSMAKRWGWRTDNPVKGIERNTEHKRHRYLTGPELSRLATALAEFPDLTVANAVRLALLTGARRGELLAARWEDFDLAAGVWTKPGATTKQKTLHRVALSDVAVRLLVEMRRHALLDVWVFPARGGGHLTAIREAWDALRAAADIPDVRLHDLRHTFASLSASSGASLPLIGAMLGHSSPTTTHRYAHLLDDPQRSAANKVA